MSLIALQQNPHSCLARQILNHLQQVQLLFLSENLKQSSLDVQIIEANPQSEVFSKTYKMQSSIKLKMCGVYIRN